MTEGLLWRQLIPRWFDTQVIQRWHTAWVSKPMHTIRSQGLTIEIHKFDIQAVFADPDWWCIWVHSAFVTKHSTIDGWWNGKGLNDALLISTNMRSALTWRTQTLSKLVACHCTSRTLRKYQACAQPDKTSSRMSGLVLYLHIGLSFRMAMIPEAVVVVEQSSKF
jgi:hypothetical protein